MGWLVWLVGRHRVSIFGGWDLQRINLGSWDWHCSVMIIRFLIVCMYTALDRTFAPSIKSRAYFAMQFGLGEGLQVEKSLCLVSTIRA